MTEELVVQVTVYVKPLYLQGYNIVTITIWRTQMKHLLAIAFITLLALGMGCAWISPSPQKKEVLMPVGRWSMVAEAARKIGVTQTRIYQLIRSDLGNFSSVWLRTA